MKIIAVDDEIGSGKLLQKAIAAAAPHADLRCFNDPTEALTVSRDFLPDVAFLDVNMPVMSGLELAKALLELNEKTNVIFVTGYADFAKDAFSLHASGYVTKPVSVQAVKAEFGNLRHPVTVKRKEVYIKTFGNFYVLVDGKRLNFQRAPAKEMMAYLVERGGAAVTRKELAAVLFEDAEYSRSTQSYISQIVNCLIATIKKADIEFILDFSYNAYAVKPECFRCDSYDFLAGDAVAKRQFQGEYMSQYSWGEDSIGKFLRENDPFAPV